MTTNEFLEDCDIINRWKLSFYEDNKKDYAHEKYFNFKIPVHFESFVAEGRQDLRDTFILKNLIDVAAFLAEKFSNESSVYIFVAFIPGVSSYHSEVCLYYDELYLKEQLEGANLIDPIAFGNKYSILLSKKVEVFESLLDMRIPGEKVSPEFIPQYWIAYS